MTPAEARRARMLEAYRERHHPTEAVVKKVAAARIGKIASVKAMGGEWELKGASK